MEYGAHFDNIILRLRNARFIYSAKMLYGDAAELLIEELLQRGQAQMSQVISKVTDKLNEAYQGKVKRFKSYPS